MANDTSRSMTRVKLPPMTAAILMALLTSLRAAWQEAHAQQARASKAQAANASTRKRGAEEGSVAVPVAFPEGVTRCARKLATTCTALERALAAKRSPGVNRAGLRALAQRYALRWQALRAFVTAFEHLDARDDFDPTSLRAAADAALGAKRSLEFTRGAARKAWANGQLTLANVTSKGLDAEVTALGGARVVAQLRETHAALGAALSVTTSQSPTEAPDVAALVQKARTLVADYALKVNAMIDEEVAGSAELAAMLLRPIDALRGQSPRATKAVTPPGATHEGATPAHTAEPMPAPRTGTGG